EFASMVARDQKRDQAFTRLDKTMSALALASQKGLGSAKGTELREKLARMDATLARLKGEKGPELLKGAQDVAQQLSSMSALASKAGNGGQFDQFKKLIEERRAE